MMTIMMIIMTHCRDRFLFRSSRAPHARKSISSIMCKSVLLRTSFDSRKYATRKQSHRTLLLKTKGIRQENAIAAAAVAAIVAIRY